MKLLLTSAGLTNDTLAEALLGLVGKSAGDTTIVFIPTAANLEKGDLSWLEEDIKHFKQRGFKFVDVFDIAGTSKEVWQPRLEAADIICFGGGNEQYLAKVIRDVGLDTALPELLKSRVYMGISAGSMVTGQFLPLKLMKVVYPEEVYEEWALPLGLVDFLFIPHLNSDYFTHVRKEVLEGMMETFTFPLYACDDETALRVVDEKVEIVGEGETVTL